MATRTEIADAAFSLLNVDTLETANVDTDTSLRASLFRNIYDLRRRAILASANWTFAFRFADLLKQTAPTVGGFTASYDLPDGTTDALKWNPSNTGRP